MMTKITGIPHKSRTQTYNKTAPELRLLSMLIGPQQSYTA